jgi:hypothetical protein
MVDLDLRDPEWFPVDLDVGNGAFHFMRLSPEQVTQATFLDKRMDLDWTQAALFPAIAAPGTGAVASWLWHTSFCGSTLLSQLLHAAPWTMSLREPLVLRRVSDARAANRTWREYLAPSVMLLARPWTGGGHVLIKPTHAALNIAADLMAVQPTGRGIVLTSTLADFLVSHLKKSRQTLESVPTLAERALSVGEFHRRLDAAAFNPPDLLCAAALQWAAQRELIADLMSGSPDRLRVVDFSMLQADPQACATECAAFLELPIPADVLAARAREAATVHAKAPGRAYDRHAREAEARWLLSQNENEIRQALQWADRHLIPHMRANALCVEYAGHPASTVQAGP